jgi:hypothetical protein
VFVRIREEVAATDCCNNSCARPVHCRATTFHTRHRVAARNRHDDINDTALDRRGDPHMKSRLLLIPAILTTTAAMAGPLDGSSMPPKPMDAHEQAAALLSPPQETSYDAVDRASPLAAFKDAHERAAALLSGSRTDSVANSNARVSPSPIERMSADAHAQAATLLHKG